MHLSYYIGHGILNKLNTIVYIALQLHPIYGYPTYKKECLFLCLTQPLKPYSPKKSEDSSAGLNELVIKSLISPCYLLPRSSSLVSFP